ncbi:Uu.00g006950.m01.CDS01 [Anthostomella pinea]|uniref:Uu.00g006950.m01.CDS01 n=1 Tax=Anthostomella pinea TaxID=933095 RepID=A0AAI8VLK2_9PEZI|nr:Uu.00g006950.m01.CDS01 [Anthostomella pinea]
MEHLPCVPGPKLQPFRQNGKRPDINFLGHIGRGIHAHVWLVETGGALFALKTFTFSQIYAGPERWEVEMTEEEELAYLHPFGCEARAYGKIAELGLDDVAARCHGYSMLDQKHQDRLGEADQERTFEGHRVEYIDTSTVKPSKGVYDDNRKMIETAISRKTAPKLIRNLKKLHRGGILVRDINTGNILHGYP